MLEREPNDKKRKRKCQEEEAKRIGRAMQTSLITKAEDERLQEQKAIREHKQDDQSREAALIEAARTFGPTTMEVQVRPGLKNWGAMTIPFESESRTNMYRGVLGSGRHYYAVPKEESSQ